MKKLFMSGLCLAGLTLACSADSVSTPDVAGSLTIERITPVSSSIRAGAVLTDTLVVRVSNARSGKPVGGAHVQFMLAPGAGSVERNSAVTDPSGLASPGKWQMGAGTGIKSLTVVVEGIKSVFFFTVTPDVPASIRQFAPAPMVGVAGETIGGPNVVVIDRFGNPVPNVPVTLSVVTGDGDVLPPAAMTSSFGSVTTNVRLGRTSGDVTVLVTVDGVEPDKFVVIALDPAAVSHYTLESVRRFNVMITPSATGVSTGNLTISSFDQCLCRKESGYLILDIGYMPQFNSFDLARRVGKFAIDPSGISIAAGDFTRINLVDGRIELELLRNDGDFIWAETWIFKPV